MSSLSATTRRGVMCVAVLLFLVGTWGAAKDERKQEPSEGPGTSFGTGGITHGQPDRVLAAFLIARGDRFTTHGPISLSYGVICTGTPPGRADAPRTLKLVRPYGAVDPKNRSWLSVLGPDGQDLTYQGGFVSWPLVGLERVVVLGEGQFVGSTTSDVRSSFDFKRPGKYRIRWHYEARGLEGIWEGELISNEIQIEIAR